MLAQRPFNPRRRSQSASTASSHRTSAESSKRRAIKRANPNFFYGPESKIAFKRDAEPWRTKSRRRDTSSSALSSDDELQDDDHDMASDDCIMTSAPTPTPAFAATSAEFHLFPRHNARPLHRSSNTATIYNSHQDAPPSYAELTRLRSNAFWELQRSVMENEIGFVSRMRDYEQSRSRADAYKKVKDAQKRGRKRFSLISSSRKFVPAQDESDDDVDIQLYSGGLSQPFFSRATREQSSSSGQLRARSAPGGERCSSPSSSLYVTDDELHKPQPTDSHASHTSPPQYPTSPTGLSSSNTSVTSSLNPVIPSMPSSRSEKAIAALTLALANGSGGINDYEALRSLEPVLALDDSHIGDMWQ
ncbi:hypothetical protein VNI00_001464 [Paramarasmius palmivorus]|uniref:Uncharacterized protein n=1 Tax=Paramarasmius palmivorus TaxID=297713 RepID=A0AAW0E1C9_9AGAR